VLEPFAYAFFRNAVIAATLAGALCGLVGVYVVLRHMSYIGHGLSHAIFGGAVASFATGVNFYLGAGLWGVLAALLINQVARRRTVGADAAIGVVTTASFALGLAIISRVGGFTRNFEAALFGNVLGVTTSDVVVIGAVTLIACAVVFFCYRGLLFTTFDPEVAEISGIDTRRVDALLALTLAGTITATMNVLGVTLIAAALVIPAVTARLLTDRFALMLALSVGLGATCGFAGVYGSYYLDVSSGAAVVLTGAAFFIGAYIASAVRQRARLRRSKAAPDFLTA
jgi:manganese/iron transport system permease protein/iron/zinc/copper transport system permease protein